jgi:hypothetical protein
MSILEDSYDINKYKDALIRNWKQHCERFEDYRIHNNDYNEGIDRYKFLLTDRNVKKLFENIGTYFNMSFSYRHSFVKSKNSKAEPSNIRLYHYHVKFKVDLNTYYDTSNQTIDSGGWFSKKSWNKTTHTLKEAYEEYGIKESDFNGSILEIDMYFLIFNNIIVPVSIKEGRDLLEYEKECRRKDDLAEIYRDSTFIPFDEYKDFIEWRKEKKEKDNEDFQIMEENSK